MNDSKKKTPRQVAGEKLLAVYAKLTPPKRDLLQQTLLQHAFFSAGEAYIEWADWNEYARDRAYIRLVDVTQEAADAWFLWAGEIETEGLSARTVREAILRLVEEFVWLRLSQAHQGGGPRGTPLQTE